MVLGVVDRVNANCVDAERLEVGNIARQGRYVKQRVLCIGRTTCVFVSSSVGPGRILEQQTWLVGNTTNVKTLIASEEGVTADFDRWKVSL